MAAMSRMSGHLRREKFKKQRKTEARDILGWLEGQHIDDYFACVPRDIILVVMLFLRCWIKIAYEDESPCTGLLGMMHSWDDQPTRQWVDHYSQDIISEWYLYGWMHREGGQPAHVNVNPDYCYFNWFLRNKHGRIGSTVTHMQYVNGAYSYGFPDNLVATIDPTIIAEIDALRLRYTPMSSR